MKNLIRLKKEKDNSIKNDVLWDIKILIKLKKEKKNNSIKNEVLRDLRTLSESDKEDYYEPVRISNAFDDNFIEYESNGHKHKTLSIEEYLNKIRPYLSKMVN